MSTIKKSSSNSHSTFIITDLFNNKSFPSCIPFNGKIQGKCFVFVFSGIIFNHSLIVDITLCFVSFFLKRTDCVNYIGLWGTRGAYSDILIFISLNSRVNFTEKILLDIVVNTLPSSYSIFRLRSPSVGLRLISNLTHSVSYNFSTFTTNYSSEFLKEFDFNQTIILKDLLRAK